MSEEYLKNQKRIAKLEMEIHNFKNEVIELDKKDNKRIEELEASSASHTENIDGVRRHTTELENKYEALDLHIDEILCMSIDKEKEIAELKEDIKEIRTQNSWIIDTQQEWSKDQELQKEVLRELIDNVVFQGIYPVVKEKLLAKLSGVGSARQTEEEDLVKRMIKRGVGSGRADFIIYDDPETEKKEDKIFTINELMERIINSEVVLWKFFKMKYDLAKKYGNGDIYKFYGELLTSLEVEKQDLGGEKPPEPKPMKYYVDRHDEYWKKMCNQPLIPVEFGYKTFKREPREDDVKLCPICGKFLDGDKEWNDYAHNFIPVKREDLQWLYEYSYPEGVFDDDLIDEFYAEKKRIKEVYGID